ncbi:hypothetical protein GCM10009839_14000 [Catenulispora yoronensis]|uniref:Uncharacterized protein n=1 Tax=Catenulispora yoronensis TaxID=450799 RepID=A0ABP5F9G0_9ACTN
MTRIKNSVKRHVEGVGLYIHEELDDGREVVTLNMNGVRVGYAVLTSSSSHWSAHHHKRGRVFATNLGLFEGIDDAILAIMQNLSDDDLRW